ncbi:hypothetical protein EGR_06136 [Echinococcus granulosus]|uniref:Uncharacterized protein n=1 Tax=Echinococcus granulosus TaxID=6210 RepID=W6UCM4_ECHGR|nr:hypothetical protein EGR_06136 [Echinococcus granulosus]EUB59020.1 hypothetical protein EGR_06136 [Echinococcus granulosus]
MVIWNHTPIITISWICDSLILFATENKIFTCDVKNGIIRPQGCFPPDKAIFKIMCCPSSVKCSCRKPRQLDITLEIELKFITVFGNNLCVILSISKDANVKTLFSLATTEFICGAYVHKRGIIFAVDLCKPSFTSTCLLASAAEDRSIVIWSSQFDELCGSPQSRFTEWNILHRLDVCAINLKMPLFESRVWCVQMNDWGIIAAGEITGGNDGALVLNQIEIPQPEEKVGVFQDGLVGCVKPLTNVPAVKRPSSLAKHSFPSDTYFNQFPDKKQSLLLDNESVMISPVLRDVFIGPEGRIFTIFESGGIAILRPDNGKAAELTPMQSYLSPTLSKRVAKGAEFVDKDGVCLKQDRLFPGYCVSGVHRGSRRFALGGRWGCLGIYEIIDDETLLCHDLVNLPPFQRITLIHWISESEIVVGIFPNVTTIFERFKLLVVGPTAVDMVTRVKLCFFRSNYNPLYDNLKKLGTSNQVLPLKMECLVKDGVELESVYAPVYGRLAVQHAIWRNVYLNAVHPVLNHCSVQHHPAVHLDAGIMDETAILRLATPQDKLKGMDSEVVEVYIGLNNVASSNGLFHRALYLERNFTHSQRDELAWTTCAASWTSQEPIPLRCIIIGTRVGGISLYNLPSDSNSTVIQPTWSLEHCHGREGVTSITILHQAIVLTAGRQHGRVRRWRILITEGGSKIGLQLLDQVLKPSHLSWIESFASLPSGEVLALGFLSFCLSRLNNPERAVRLGINVPLRTIGNQGGMRSSILADSSPEEFEGDCIDLMNVSCSERPVIYICSHGE